MAEVLRKRHNQLELNEVDPRAIEWILDELAEAAVDQQRSEVELCRYCGTQAHALQWRFTDAPDRVPYRCSDCGRFWSKAAPVHTPPAVPYIPQADGDVREVPDVDVRIRNSLRKMQKEIEWRIKELAPR